MSEWRDLPGDPWRDLPASDEPADPPSPVQPTSDAVASTDAVVPGGDAVASSGAVEARTCAWCATPAAGAATRCSSCGAALAQRESIGDLVIPGLTAVDPALKDYDARPLQLRGPSPSQGIASGVVVAAAAGGPIGLAALGGIAAVAAAEYIGAGGANGAATLGETSEAVKLAIEKLERGEALPSAADETPREPHTDAVGPDNEEGSNGRT